MIVIKVGGNAISQLNLAFLQQIDAWLNARETVILVHGAGPMFDEALAFAQVPVTKIDGLRYTDEPTMTVMRDVLQQQVQPLIQHLFAQAHVAVNIVTNTVTAQVKAAGKYGLVGEVEHIHFTPKPGELMVVGPLLENAAGEWLNVNADEVALAVAKHFQADALYFVTDVAGVWDENKVILDQLTPTLAAELMQQKIVTAGMFVKLNAAFAALQAGVKRIQLGQTLTDGTKLILEETT
ncbi:MAG TPA: acetylglutamate kinase [Lactobacillaceae bacterium]|jgi:acetylglutamate kinase